MDDQKRGNLVIKLKKLEILVLEDTTSGETIELVLFDQHGLPMPGKISIKCSKKHKITRKFEDQ